MAKTRHTFQLMVDGGVQTVTVTDALDEAQIGLVQKYLQEEAERFQKGDFSNAMGIHDDGFPGLSELKAGARQLTIRYNVLSDGGQIRYITSNPELVNATHRWLMAQLAAQGKLSPSR